MANFALISTPAQAIRFDVNPVTGAFANPKMAWPATGGVTHDKRNEQIYIPLLPPPSSTAIGGETTGQLFPIGNR